MLAKQPS